MYETLEQKTRHEAQKVICQTEPNHVRPFSSKSAAIEFNGGLTLSNGAFSRRAAFVIFYQQPL
jgi:hypothetical protein